eukprot:TRINITY_DN11527_c0_g1_i1.p1 TRINITY_DN11527_c0_g1~~TRINITY_DN11527_c0_g1_i1.p1  ORF type:complete len:334 (+),score=88.10 TRINITY_DN11527_c0_g1_i1:34-1035(+)
MKFLLLTILLYQTIFAKYSFKNFIDFANESLIFPKTSTEKHVLGYITPWHANGYQLGLTGANYFSHLSPCYFTINNQCKISGLDVVDKNWLKLVKEKNPNIKIVPRIRFEIETFDEKCLISTLKKMNNITKIYNFDGYVIDLGNKMLEAVKYENVFEVLDKIRIISIPAPRMKQNVSPWLKIINSNVWNFVQLYCYDYNPGISNAPIEWINFLIKTFENLDKNKIFFGLNFYGYVRSDVINPKPLIGSEVIQMIENGERKGRILYSKKLKEHKMILKVSDNKPTYTITYPTKLSICERVKAIQEEAGFGIAIWELGQGFPSYVNLLDYEQCAE